MPRRSQASTTIKRRKRERKTIDAMIALYCRDQHTCRGRLCAECAALGAYAQQRLEKCPFGDDKPTCAKCPIHCYKPACREQIQAVMRYAGPRILLQRPILAIRHMLDERKAAPAPPRRQGKQAADGR
ncbi:MAG TPA: nitrous oxide-stimulated promoter family protein [Candidatus Acidoferrales bacterium]|nr:nitrous oxide-stimulated promoter family protein [Candidatus Acidoferrales bacterium]